MADIRKTRMNNPNAKNFGVMANISRNEGHLQYLTFLSSYIQVPPGIMADIRKTRMNNPNAKNFGVMANISRNEGHLQYLS